MRISPRSLPVLVAALALAAAPACRRDEKARQEGSPIVAKLPGPTGAGVPPRAEGGGESAAAARADALPLCVVLEGQSPTKVAPTFADLSSSLRLVVIELPPVAGGGDLAGEAERLAQLIAQARDTRPTRGKPILVGAGRGGTLALLLAAQAPTTLGAVIVVGADWPPDVLPKGPVPDAGSPPLRIYIHHGSRDEGVPVAAAGRSSDELALRGLSAVLQLDPRAGHEPSPRLLADMKARLGEEARAQH